MMKLFKKIIYLILIIFTIYSFTKDKPIYDSNININDLLNYKNKIKIICVKDYCDYLKGENIRESIDIFMKNYLKTINDEELKNTLKVKGIEVSKIILD